MNECKDEESVQPEDEKENRIKEVIDELQTPTPQTPTPPPIDPLTIVNTALPPSESLEKRHPVTDNATLTTTMRIVWSSSEGDEEMKKQQLTGSDPHSTIDNPTHLVHEEEKEGVKRKKKRKKTKKNVEVTNGKDDAKQGEEGNTQSAEKMEIKSTDSEKNKVQQFPEENSQEEDHEDERKDSKKRMRKRKRKKSRTQQDDLADDAAG